MLEVEGHFEAVLEADLDDHIGVDFGFEDVHLGSGRWVRKDVVVEKIEEQDVC